MTLFSPRLRPATRDLTSGRGEDSQRGEKGKGVLNREMGRERKRGRFSWPGHGKVIGGGKEMGGEEGVGRGVIHGCQSEEGRRCCGCVLRLEGLLEGGGGGSRELSLSPFPLVYGLFFFILPLSLGRVLFRF